VFRFVRTLTLAVAAAAATLLAPGTASAGAAPTITLTPTSVETGANYQVSGTGWGCPFDIDLTIDNGVDGPTPLGTIAVADVIGGQWSATFAAPATDDIYTVTAAYTTECQNVATAVLTVTPPPTTTTTTTTTTLAPTTTTEAPTTTLAPTTTVAVTTTSLAAAPVVLPETGSSDPATSWAALALLAGGVAMVFAARRRHT
jgi:LPXTG-motif cell wall-anchored protein